MIRETAAWTLVLAVLLTGCGPGDRLPDDPGTPAEAVGSLVCPEVPVPSLEGVEDAVKELVQEQLAAVEEDCSGPELGRLGMLYHAYDFFGGAEECYRLAEERDAQELRWPYFQGHLLANRGATDEAEAKFGRALDLDPSCRVAKLHLAEVLLRSNELDRAEALFQETLVDGEDDAFTLFGLARIAAARGRPEAAIPRFQKALELDPEADAIHYALALAYRDAGETELAQKHLSRRGKVKPAPLDSYLAELRQFRIGARTHIIQAQFAHQAGHWEEAERLYREALKEDPEEVDTWVNLGIVLLKQGRIDEAVELLESAVAADPDAIAARYHLAENHLRHGHPERAVEHLEKALAREPGRVSLELALAAAYRSSGRFDDALERYRRAVEVDPGNPEGRLGRALCLARLHRFAEARQSLEEDLRAQPDQPAFRHALARVLAAAPDSSTRDGAAALALLEKLRDAAPSADFMETVAMALAEEGRFDLALEWQGKLQEIARRANAPSAVQDRLARNLALYQAGRPCREPWADDDPLFTARSFWGAPVDPSD